MALDQEAKASIRAEYATAEGDTGSPEVQVAVLTKRIAELTTCRRRTSPATGRSSSGSVCAGDVTGEGPDGRSPVPRPT